MRLLEDLALFLLGLGAALAAVSFFRLGTGIWPLVQLPVIFMALAVFYLKESRLSSLAAGLGVGLDVVSAYPFFSWTCIVGGTTLVGWWLSKSVFTNRSLPSLLLLGVSMRLAYFLLEVIVSRAGQLFGSKVWYLVAISGGWQALCALGIEIAALALVFIVHIRVRGERARMLTHL